MAGAALIGHTSGIDESLPPASVPAPGPRQQLAELANLTAAAAGAAACAVRWRDGYAEGVARTAAASRWGAALDAIAARIETGAATGAFHLNGPALESIMGGRRRGAPRRKAAALVSERGGLRAMFAVVVSANRDDRELEALLKLSVDGALRILEGRERERARDFWRRRAIDLGQQSARESADARAREADRKLLDEASAAAMKLRPRNRFAGLGTIFARLGPFDAWLVVVEDDGELRAAAASAVLARIAPLSGASSIAECIRVGSALHRSGDRGAGREEDRLFAGYNSYLCVPLGAGAIALASRQPIDPATIARVEALGRRLEPILRDWRSQGEIQRLRRLVGNLGLRMFGAIDSERARIARDLHDHQAQLLAAARIALEAGPEEARGIFKQVEDSLRLRVRELRPALLGRATLADALRYELRRLADAGINGRLSGIRRMNSLTRPVQQLCYQVAREALSNVVRHSGATQVRIDVEKRGGRVVLTIFDNGKGVASSRHGRGCEGIGLSGMGERLEMMGGKVEIDSRAGATRIIATIPEPD